ncbi:MAG: cell division ATP-binding protein FtsE [Proteobacteria bacterium]|jgi:cell division transport system ATP-binding protein|nr:cell division ATP-binding protein FtsE [Pseudomonadota bacterium]
MIQFFRVTKKYDEKTTVLQDLNLDIEKGEFVFLTGKSGAGKTTLMKMIFCEEFPSDGQIIVDGRNISRLKPVQIAQLRRTIGVVFQDFKLISTRTVFDNVALALQVMGVPYSDVRRKVTTILRMVGLEQHIHSYPLELSGGEQQRVAIARALVNDPKILLADEPTGNLDPALALEIIDLFQNIHIRGTTILMATHERSLVERVRGRELKLEKGAIHAVG